MTAAEAQGGTVRPSCVAKASPRERLLDSAVELFTRQGVRVGIHALCEAAGVSRRSLYQHFRDKDDLIAASLDRQEPALAAVLIPPPGEPGPPRDRILYVFRQLENLAQDPGYPGCPFLSALLEIKDHSHPASVVALRHMNSLSSFFRSEAELGGAADPVFLSRQLALVYDGAAARAGTGAEHLEGLALATAASLLDAANMTN